MVWHSKLQLPRNEAATHLHSFSAQPISHWYPPFDHHAGGPCVGKLMIADRGYRTSQPGDMEKMATPNNLDNPLVSKVK